jgi:hypothetical protein
MVSSPLFGVHFGPRRTDGRCLALRDFAAPTLDDDRDHSRAIAIDYEATRGELQLFFGCVTM